ncbi:MAG: hypothetical protein ACUVQP_10810 [Bacteroidales bacterium]
MEITTKILLYSLTSIFIISLMSFVGFFTLAIKKDKIKNFLIYFVAFLAGTLFSDVFFHRFPEISEETGFTLTMAFATLFGISFSFFIEKIICWHHCHLPIEKNHLHRFAYMNLLEDFLQSHQRIKTNFIFFIGVSTMYLLTYLELN